MTDEPTGEGTAGEPETGPPAPAGAGDSGDAAGRTGEGRDPLAVAEEHPVLLFDGVCNLCNRSVQFVIEHDPGAQFRFAPLQSDVAQDLLDRSGYEGERLDSVVLVEGGECYVKSDAVVRTARHLGGVFGLLGPARVVPSSLRDVVYDLVAARRYRWFGRRDRCMVPTPDRERRFLVGGPGETGDST